MGGWVGERWGEGSGGRSERAARRRGAPRRDRPRGEELGVRGGRFAGRGVGGEARPSRRQARRGGRQRSSRYGKREFRGGARAPRVWAPAGGAPPTFVASRVLDRRKRSVFGLSAPGTRPIVAFARLGGMPKSRGSTAPTCWLLCTGTLLGDLRRGNEVDGLPGLHRGESGGAREGGGACDGRGERALRRVECAPRERRF